MVRRAGIWLVGLMVLFGGVAWSTPAEAQQFGVRAGASGDPDQFYFGVHADTSAIANRVSFRPNVEVGIGDGLTLVGLNLEFIYRRDLPSSEWNLLVGGGPAANLASYSTGRRADETDLGGGLNLLLGIEHRGGFFAEVKVGIIDSPSVKFGVGFSFGR